MASTPESPSDSGRPTALRERWRRPESGQHYSGGRFTGQRARSRDARLIASLLRRHGPAPGRGVLLDVPCGTGRLHPLLAAHGAAYLGLDISEVMLSEGRSTRLARADVRHLPLHSASFDAVICCRLLHHLREPELLRDTLTELLRVTRGLLIASFWDASCLPAWRARHGLRRRAHPETRVSIPKHELEEHLDACGAKLLGYAHSCRFLSQQTFFAACPTDKAPEQAGLDMRGA